MLGESTQRRSNSPGTVATPLKWQPNEKGAYAHDQPARPRLQELHARPCRRGREPRGACVAGGHGHIAAPLPRPAAHRAPHTYKILSAARLLGLRENGPLTCIQGAAGCGYGCAAGFRGFPHVLSSACMYDRGAPRSHKDDSGGGVGRPATGASHAGLTLRAVEKASSGRSTLQVLRRAASAASSQF
ncbi:hypothetical protein BC834DRAFT_230205 [Gloeopeniophorella convolvens]|nr:hypothetical protein BC834DRAFT_230205 [Gloeopeniophorella convolvens]